jgi:hypothetical protein
MKDKELEILLNELENWSGSVGRKAADIIPQVKEAVESTKPLPNNCSSRAVLAGFILREIYGPVSEVTGIMKMIEEHLDKHYGDKK